MSDVDGLRQIATAALAWMTACSVLPGHGPAPPVPAEPQEPPAEVTGEAWAGEGVPPPRNPNVRWYHKLPVDQLWREISTAANANVVLITVKRAGLERGYFNGRVLISERELAEARRALLQIPGVVAWDGPEEDHQLPVMPDGRRYPAIVLQLMSIESLQRAIELQFIEAIEPMFIAMDGVGCSLEPYTPNPADKDFSGNRVPWSFEHLGVIDAWNLYKASNTIIAPGFPTRIGVIDTGVYQEQHQLTTLFQSGPRSAASNRTVVSGAFDDCGHGTRIAGLATAPFDFQNDFPREIVGVAWGAELTTVKYNSGVVALRGSRVALVNAIQAAVDDGARVVNLALGMPYWDSFVSDFIETTYRTTQTLFVVAAGTFVSKVTFPAVMSEVMAVSIVKAKDPADPGAGYELYGGLAPESAYGPEVDFAAVNGEGGVPTTGDGSMVVTLGGSSSGTAHLSGIAALAWGKQPGATRAQVVARLQRSGSLKLISGEERLTPGHSAHVGYGIPDAYVAAGGARIASISGPTTVMPGATYTLTATTDGWLPMTYVWASGGRSASSTFTAPASGTVSHQVAIFNPIDGKTLTARHSVLVARSHKRILYSDPVIVRFPPYPFKGGTYDVAVNHGGMMPVGCSVVGVLGQAVHKLNGQYVHSQPPVSSLYLASSYGFTISRPGGIGARDLAADARVWHGGTHAVRVKVHYIIAEPDGIDCNMPGLTVHGWFPP